MRKTIKCLLLFVFITLISNLAYAQTKITGTVVDESNTALPGVNIIIKGTTEGTISDLNGNYSITANTDGTLEFSFMGYETQSVSINGQTTINITMQPSSEVLDDVVVVGYGTQKRSDITGAVASVNSEALKERPITNIEEALTGQVTGLQISSTGGQPGAATKMNIRGITSMSGSSQPLVVVDGFPLSEVNTSAGGAGGEAFGVQIGAMSYINPDDIESIEVLKDASATAIYGNRGANGVIMITTKKGMKGSSGITYSAYYGIQEMKKRIEVMNFGDWAGYHVLRNSTSELFVDPDGNPYIFSDPEAMNINWQDEIYRRGIIQNHSLSMQGKAEKTSYTLSASYNQNQSILVETDFKKFTSRMSVDHQFSDKILVGSNLSFSNVNYNGTITDGREGTAAGLVIQALEARPYRLDQNTAARFRRAGVPGNVVENYLSNYYGGPDEIAKNVDLDKSINRFISNFYINAQILDWLAFRSTFGADFYNLKGKQFYSKNSPGGALDNGRAWQTARNELSLISENYFTLNKNFDAHKVNLVTGWSVQKNTSEYASAYAYDFENELLGYNSLGLGAQFQVSSNAYERFLASYLARANYSYDDRYLLTVSYRRDASSIFLENKWGDFYSGALAWNVKNESFLDGVDFISNLKIRTSWGQTGNQNIPIQGALLDGEISDYTFDGQYYTGVSASTLENKNLNWETSQQLNAGIDLGFFGNKLNIVADYYVTNTKDLLLYTPVSISTGFEFGWFNVGELKNSGYELAINYGLDTDIGFKWNTSLNITSSKNEILALGRDGEPIYIDVNFDTKVKDEVILQVGGSINDYFGYKVDGIYTAGDYDVNGDLLPEVPSEGAGELPGDVKYKDISGPDGTPDGFIDAYDRTVIGNALPDFYGSFSNNFSFKGIELDVVFNFSYGNDIFNATKTRISAFTAADNQTTEWLDSYVNNPGSTQYSRMTSSVPSELLIEDGSFLRLQTLRLGYNLPASLTSKIKAQSVKVYLAANNLALFTKYSGYDPEVTSNQGGASFIQGFDYGAFPRAKTFLLGLNIQF